MATTPEKLIETTILNWLNSLEDCFAFKINTGGIYDPRRKVWRKITNPHIHKGTSDIVGTYNKKFFAIEVKANKGKASKDQITFLKRVIANGSYGLVTHSLEECKVAFVKHFGPVEMKNSVSGDVVLFRENIL